MPDTDTNPFLAYADTVARTRRPMRARLVKSEAEAPMKPTAQEKEHRDKTVQLRLYREHHREELEIARRGEFGPQLLELEKFMRRMTIDDGAALVDLVKRSRLAQADKFARIVVLRLVDDAIARLRAQNGLAPFDDSLPGKPPKVFEQIRAELGLP